ncbi:DUF2167 domain-containing protein [Hyphomonas sp. NPDC076900]|uniref:DUF2167 domain-containing protein n=1 Tax=unclassified Hyphomonas TaxID=2630699 RepID=UPI003CFCDAEB
MKIGRAAISAVAAVIILSGGPIGLAAAQAPDAAIESEDYTPEEMEAAYRAFAEEILQESPARHGEVILSGAPARLQVSDGFDFYDKAGARKILEDIWGNPPDDTVLGMIFPAGVSPVDAAWGAVLTYEASGYVSDDDAAGIDYAELLQDMQKATREANKERSRLGYATVELRGWAERPRYEAGTHRLYWAKDLIFSDSEGVGTLNYDMRLLGRSGVLSVNFIGTIDALEEVRAAAPDVLGMAAFNPGQTYADFQPGDKTAGYGVAALIAGGAGAAALKKAGVLTVLLALLKKGWILIPLALGGLWKMITGLFRRRQAP